MVSLLIKNIRTFVGLHDIPIRPLTILTGENSSGKSTCLAALATVCDPDGFPFSPGFDKPPYHLGSYETIATDCEKGRGQASTFAIGFQRADDRTTVLATYGSSTGGRPAFRELKLSKAERTICKVTVEESRASLTGALASLVVGDFSYKFPFDVGKPTFGRRPASFFETLFRSMRKAPSTSEGRENFFKAIEALPVGGIDLGMATSIAPIRSRPERVYSEATAAFEPTGDHIPFVLKQLFREHKDSPETRALVQAVHDFGQESGLFSNLRIKQLGKSSGDPFQLIAKIAGRDRNVIDVGYGVSQAIPVVAQSILSSSSQYMLMQQPEVHLHPRAQAALGTFFSGLVKEGSRSFVIETHSDFLIDRVRQEIAAKTLPADHVGILFFERDGLKTTIHDLRLDEQGNVLNTPPGYRRFFMEEEMRLLTRGKAR